MSRVIDPQLRLWVAEIRISERTAAKVQSLHNLDVKDIRDAVVCRTGLPFKWDEDPERGLRAIVKCQIGGREALVVLYPIGDDVYHLGSAYPLNE
jgi:hypothetical protein